MIALGIPALRETPMIECRQHKWIALCHKYWRRYVQHVSLQYRAVQTLVFLWRDAVAGRCPNTRERQAVLNCGAFAVTRCPLSDYMLENLLTTSRFEPLMVMQADREIHEPLRQFMAN